jgi:hypothetical protein
MQSRILKFFTYAHLNSDLKPISEQCCKLADSMEESLPEGPEKSAGLRKLLETKDCFIRAKLDSLT